MFLIFLFILYGAWLWLWPTPTLFPLPFVPFVLLPLYITKLVLFIHCIRCWLFECTNLLFVLPTNSQKIWFVDKWMTKWIQCCYTNSFQLVSFFCCFFFKMKTPRVSHLLWCFSLFWKLLPFLFVCLFFNFSITEACYNLVASTVDCCAMLLPPFCLPHICSGSTNSCYTIISYRNVCVGHWNPVRNVSCNFRADK